MNANKRAGCLAVAAALLCGLFVQDGRPATASAAAALAVTPRYEFQGFVYQGRPSVGRRLPLAGVSVALWGSDQPDRMGILLDSTLTDRGGSFYLSTPELTWQHYSLIETDPDKYVSTGAVAGPLGTVRNYNWIQYSQFLNVTLYDGNEFYDEPEPTPTPTSTDTPTSAPPTATRTATATFTSAPPTATWTPAAPTATLTPERASRTPTPVSPTPTPAPLVVNTTADHDDGSCDPLASGDCTLREALGIANQRAGPDTIVFDIPEADPGHDPDTRQWTIRPQSPLPPLADAGTRIDGAAQAGPSEGGQVRASALGPLCGGPGKIVINFYSAGGGFVANGANGVLTMLTIIGGPDLPAVIIGGSSGYGNKVYCNTIRGSASAGALHIWEGVKITTGAHDNLIEANTIDNCSAGVYITGGAHHNAVERNWIGSLGPGALPNLNAGVIIDGGAHHNTVGHASAASQGNVISGNGGPGVVIGGAGSNSNVVAHNRIGLQPATDQARANSGAGVQLAQQAGGNTIGPGNVIAYNTAAGVAYGGTGAMPGPNVVTWNSIYDNGGPGIVNQRLAPPLISSVGPGKVQGTTNPACAGCTVELFTNPSHSAAQPAEGKTPLARVTTQADGSWQWTGYVPYLSWVTATLTKSGDTSGFSTPVQEVEPLVVTFWGTACRGEDCLKTLKAVVVILAKKKGDGWVEVNRTRTDAQGRFTLPVALSELPAAYRLLMSDPRYRVTGARSASGGTVRDDGSIEFTISDPGERGGNDLYLDLAGWVFRGRVEARAAPGRPRPLPVEVSLYGAQVEQELGQKLAAAPTGDGGEFELQYAPAGGEGFAYYTLAVEDPAYRILEATPGSGGRVTPEGHIRFDHLPPGDFEENEFVLESLWTAVTKPTVVAFQVISPTGLVAVLPPRDFVIEGIEVTQAIQCFVDPSSAIGSADCPMDNALPLVAGKLAAVRVYVTVNETCWAASEAGSVAVDLHVSWGIQGSVQRAVHKAQCAPSTWRRANAAGTANFYLMVPDAQQVHIWAEVNADQGWPEPDYVNNRYPATGTVDLDFQARRSLGVGYFLVDYHPKPSLQYGPYQGPAQASAAWAASPAASGLLYGVYPTGSLAYDNLGVFKYSGTDVRDLYTPPGGQGVCGHCELFWELYKRWLALKMMACLNPADCPPKPDVVFGWLPLKAFEAAPFVGLADSTTKKVALGAAGLPHDVLAHEVGHILGLKHAKCQSSGDPFEDPAWPYTSQAIQQVGFDVGKGVPISPFAASDMMAVGNCKVGTEWISPYHWNKLFSALAPSSAGQSKAVALQETYALVSGLINADGTGRLDPLFVLSSGAELPAPEGGPYCLNFYGAGGARLGSYCFTPDFADPISGGTGSVAYFAYALPLPEGAVRLALQRDEMVVAQRSASSSAPEVRFTSPAGGETWEASHQVRWTASDADGDALTYALFYSHDDGGSWQPVALGLTETTHTLQTDTLPGGQAVRLRVLASDGYHTTAADSAAFRVPAKAPMVHISAPADGSAIAPGQALFLQGRAQDLEAALPEAALSWWSDRDGLLGRGGTLIVPGLTLSPGEQIITLRAVDSDGQTGSATVRIRVGLPVHLPLVLRAR